VSEAESDQPQYGAASSQGKDRLQEANRKPGNKGNQEQSEQDRSEIGPDLAHGGVARHSPDGTSRIKADAKGRGKQANPHGKDYDRRIVHRVNPPCACGRK
jgi:hypothetical protein